MNSFQALGDSLGVVNPVDADTHNLTNVSQEGPPFRFRNRYVRAAGRLRALVEINADRKSSNCCVIVAHSGMCPIIIDKGVQIAMDGIQKIGAGPRKLEAKQIIPQKSLQQLTLPRKGSKHFIGWPGNVPELGDRELWIGSLQDSSQ